MDRDMVEKFFLNTNAFFPVVHCLPNINFIADLKGYFNTKVFSFIFATKPQKVILMDTFLAEFGPQRALCKKVTLHKQVATMDKRCLLPYLGSLTNHHYH